MYDYSCLSLEMNVKLCSKLFALCVSFMEDVDDFRNIKVNPSVSTMLSLKAFLVQPNDQEFQEYKAL